MKLKEGGRCSVPVRVSNIGSSPFRVRQLSYSVPGHQADVPLRAGFRLAAGEVEELVLSINLDRAGEYAVELHCELDWDYGRRVGLLFRCAGVVTAGTRDALIRSDGGTGNMIYVSGATSQIMAEMVAERDSSAVPFLALAPRPLSVADLPDFGDPRGAVTLATALEVPDFIAVSKGEPASTIVLWPDPKAGILLGRDRPSGSCPNHAALRIPGRITGGGELTKSLSATHWRLWPNEGRWWLEVLGRRPTLVNETEVGRGQPVALDEGVILCPLTERPSALRLRLKHLGSQDGFVTRSCLEVL